MRVERHVRGHAMLTPFCLAHDRPLQQQLYDQLRDLLVSGGLQAGMRMPSTRLLAEQLAISRITVLLTYERLIAEGYLETVPAKGTFVAASSAEFPDVAELAVPTAPSSAPAADAMPERVGGPDPSLFPAGRWHTLMRGALNRLGSNAMLDQDATASALRDAIARWLSASRGLAVHPDQIMPLNGRRQALHLVAHLVAGSGGAIVMEDPGDSATALALASEGAALVRVPVDADGLRTERLPKGKAALVHVTPEHQRPLGAVLTRPRREALLAWARRSGALVLEEDCDGELRYGGSQPSLMSLDKGENVLFLGGFCKSLGPRLTRAYLALPRRLVRAASAAWQAIDDSRQGIEELALADLLNGGGYARHVHRLGKIYVERRNALREALRRHFGPQVAIRGGDAGLHLAWYPDAEMGPAGFLASTARGCGLDAMALDADPPSRQIVLLGFGWPDVPEIEARIAALAGRVHATAPASAVAGD